MFLFKVVLCFRLYQQNGSLHMHCFTLPQTSQSTTLTESELKYQYTYLVFSIFKNCKISENCINLKALKNLKPVRKKKDHMWLIIIQTTSITFDCGLTRPSYLSYFHPCLSASLDSYWWKKNSNWPCDTKCLLYYKINILKYISRKKTSSTIPDISSSSSLDPAKILIRV